MKFEMKYDTIDYISYYDVSQSSQDKFHLHTHNDTLVA